MSTSTPRLALKRPDGADPFLRQDFVDNWDKLDTAPGVHICTASSRPTWSTAHAGREILETDTLRTLIWTGTVWAEPLVAVGQWGFAIEPNTWLAPGAIGTYSLGSITLRRPAVILTMHSTRLGATPATAKQANCSSLVNDVNRDLGGNSGYVAWGSGSGVGDDHRTVAYYGQIALGAGTHTIKTHVTTSTHASSLYVGTASCVVLTVAGNGGATLS